MYVLLSLLQVEGKVCIEELWKISLLWILDYKEKRVKVLKLSSVTLFLPSANMDHLFYASPSAPIQGTSVKRTWFLCFKELCNLKDRCVYDKTHCDRCYTGGVYDRGWEAQEKL